RSAPVRSRATATASCSVAFSSPRSPALWARERKFAGSVRRAPWAASASDIGAAQELRRALVEHLAAAHVLEAAEEVLRAQAALVRTGEVVEHASAVHHHQPLAERRRVLHGVGD